MKVLLINPIIRENDVPRNIPHGLAILASILRNKGHKVRILDINAHRYSKKEVSSLLRIIDYEIVGIGGLISTYDYVKWLTKIVKNNNPKIPIIIGGSVGFSIPNIILSSTYADIVCNQEGEETFPELLEVVEKGSKRNLNEVQGIWFIDNGQIIQTPVRQLISNLDKIPFPAWDLLPMDVYLNNPVVGVGRDIDFISSRGCPYKCTFCFRAFGNKYRGHSAEYVLEVIKFLKKKYNVDFISFQDDEFMAKKERVYEVCEGIRNNNINIKWSCTGRVNIVDKEILNEMKRSGCVSVSYGIESGSQKILNSMRKGVTVEQAEKAINLNKEVGLRTPTSFILGMPEETLETAEETVNFCLRTNILLQGLMFATPYPGTELYRDAKTRNLIPDNEENFISKLGDAVDFTINLTYNFTDEQLIDLRKYMINKVKENYIAPSKKEINDFYKNLYGTQLWEKYRNSLKDVSFRKHRELHGFNEL